MTPELWALEGVLAVGLALVLWALWPEREPRAPRHPSRVPEHAAWTMDSSTEPLAARPGPVCECPTLLLGGRLVEPAKHYAGCPKAPPGVR